MPPDLQKPLLEKEILERLECIVKRINVGEDATTISHLVMFGFDKLAFMRLFQHSTKAL